MPDANVTFPDCRGLPKRGHFGDAPSEDRVSELLERWRDSDQYLLQLRQGIPHWLLAALAANVHLVHPRIERARPDQRVGGDQIIEPIHSHLAEHVGGQG